MSEHRSRLAGTTQWVVKVGSALVTNDGRGLDRERIADWVRQIATLQGEGVRTVLVSSGSVAEGVQRLGWRQRPHALYQLQASRARSLFDQVLTVARGIRSRKYEAEARACLGLLDLLAGDRRAADRQYRKVQSLIDERSLSQEGFKMAWFAAFCGEEGSPAEVLRERAESYRETDTLSHLKLLWLAEISDGDGQRGPSEEVRSRLRDHGLLWFEKFADRWMRVSRGNLAAV
jgi:hypothetical protein